MTDLLDAPDTGARPPASEPAAPERDGGGGDRAYGLHWVVAACLAGAGAIHLAMAPSHLGESSVEGWGFVISAWAQLLLALAVLVRPNRRVALGVIATNAALIAVWLVSRTAGLPFGEHAGH